MNLNQLVRCWTAVICAAVLIPAGAVGATAAQGTGKLAPDVPMPQDVVMRMLTFAGVTRDDTVYDIGSGDGRIVIAAAKKYGARSVGIEIDPKRGGEGRRRGHR